MGLLLRQCPTSGEAEGKRVAEELQSLQVDLITFSKACTYVADNIITIPSIYKVSFLFKKKSVYAILKLLSLHLEKEMVLSHSILPQPS